MSLCGRQAKHEGGDFFLKRQWGDRLLLTEVKMQLNKRKMVNSVFPAEKWTHVTSVANTKNTDDADSPLWRHQAV